MGILELSNLLRLLHPPTSRSEIALDTPSPSNNDMTPPDPSSTPMIMAGVIPSVIAARFAWRSRSVIRQLFLVILTLCFLVPTAVLIAGMNPWLVDGRYRTYLKFYWSLRQNMTHAEVIAVMNDFYPPNDVRLPPMIIEDNSTSLSFYMNPEDKSEPNAEGIFLKIEDGRVIDMRYVPDRTPKKDAASISRPPQLE